MNRLRNIWAALKRGYHAMRGTVPVTAPAPPAPRRPTTKKVSPVHLGTSVFTLVVLLVFWVLVYLICLWVLGADGLNIVKTTSLPKYLNWFPVIMTVHSMFKCYVAPCAPKTTRVHYFLGITSEAWQSHEGQMSFWIGPLINGRLTSLYVNNIPNEEKKIVSALYGRKDDGSDKDGASIEFAGGFLPNTNPPQPDRAKMEPGKIKASIDWRIVDAIALMSQLIKKFSGEVEVEWNEELQAEAEALIVPAHLFPKIRDACLNTDFKDIRKEVIQAEIDEQVIGSTDASGTFTMGPVNQECLAFGVAIKTVPISDLRPTNPETIEMLSRTAREELEMKREMANLTQSINPQLTATITMLDQAGYAKNLAGDERTAALAKQALVITLANNNLQTPIGTALQQVLQQIGVGKEEA